MFAVGVGDADKYELLKFTLGNEENIVSLSNFNQLSQSVKLLTKSISALQSEGKSLFEVLEFLVNSFLNFIGNKIGGTGATKRNTFESAVLGTSSYSPLITKTNAEIVEGVGKNS